MEQKNARPLTKNSESKPKGTHRRNFTAEAGLEEHKLEAENFSVVAASDFKKYDSRSNEQIAKLKKMINQFEL
jgi:hypothetical protein